jgi:DHA1 family tetracycline resistance protein-like MFS transporter
MTFAAYAAATEGWMVFLIIPFGALAGVLGPAINQIMTARTPKNAQGELQGAIASVQSLTRTSSRRSCDDADLPLLHLDQRRRSTSPAQPLRSPPVVCAISLIPLMRGLKIAPKLEDAACLIQPVKRDAAGSA